MSEEKPKGLKYDGGKLRWSLLPWTAVKAVVEVLEFGAKKYAAHSWQAVENGEQRYWDAAIRHLMAAREGELKDEESGLFHLAHAACDVLFLLWLQQQAEGGKK